MEADTVVVVSADKAEEPLTGLGPAQLTQEPNSRNQSRSLALLVQCRGKALDFAVEFLLFLLPHLAQGCCHTVTHRFVEFAIPLGEELEHPFPRRLAADRAQHPGGVELPGVSRGFCTLEQGADHGLAEAYKQADHPLTEVLVCVIEEREQQGNTCFGTCVLEVAQRIVFEHNVRMPQGHACRFYYAGVLQLERAQDEQRGASALDVPLTSQGEEVLQSGVHVDRCLRALPLLGFFVPIRN